MADPRALRAYEPRLGHAPPAERPYSGDEVLQVVPATGWRAMFGDWTEPVAVWAVVRRRVGGRVVVVGMVPGPAGELEEAALEGNGPFLGYARDDSIDAG